MKTNTQQYDESYFDLASQMRQDQNTTHNKLMKNLHRLTSKANNSHLHYLQILRHYLRIIILHYLSYITSMA